ncbi:MAG: hypothetical protein VKJ24_07415 [Synechococcales bacterium]|nr:hypothetical protein [Synechococcales bacterium]
MALPSTLSTALQPVRPVRTDAQDRSEIAPRAIAPYQDPHQRELIKHTLRQRIQDALQCAQELPPDRILPAIRQRLQAIQAYCQSVGKTFVVVEETITCGHHDLGGDPADAATLFRGPDERASVAICVTYKGSVLHRNDSPWRVYRDAGDILYRPAYPQSQTYFCNIL